jgi:hypothetical protein
MDSASLLSRESTTLSLAKPQKGHFMALVLLRSSVVAFGAGGLLQQAHHDEKSASKPIGNCNS